MADFVSFFRESYGKLEGLACGRPVLEKPLNDFTVRLPLSTLTRHGLVSGTTGTGKSRAVQRLIEQLSLRGVPCLLSDAKGDVTGFVKAGTPENPKLSFKEEPKIFATQYWSASDLLASMRFSLQDTDPALVARLLELNPTQEGHVVLAFVHAKKSGVSIHDLDDLSAVLSEMVGNKVPGVSRAAADVVVRRVVEAQAKGLGNLFGKPDLDLKDLLGPGRHHVLYLGDVRRHASVASVLPVFLLYKLFVELPQDPKLKLVVFLDEAHTVFSGANKSLLELLERILRQIRSQGVGVFFITQNPSDLPDKILGLLNTKIVFATKAFTQTGLADVRALSGGFAKSAFYGMAQEMAKMGVGESLVSFMDEHGKSLPPIKVHWFPPQSHMGALSESELSDAARGPLKDKYKKRKKVHGSSAFVKPSASMVPSAKKAGSFIGSALALGLRGLWRGLSFVVRKVLWPTLKWLARWLAKKPKRILYLLLALAVAYLVFTYGSTLEPILSPLLGTK